MISLRRLGCPGGTPGSASPDCSGFALVGGTVKRNNYINETKLHMHRWPAIMLKTITAIKRKKQT